MVLFCALFLFVVVVVVVDLILNRSTQLNERTNERSTVPINSRRVLNNNILKFDHLLADWRDIFSLSLSFFNHQNKNKNNQVKSMTLLLYND